MIILRPEDGPIPVAWLPTWLALPIPDGVREVRLSYYSYRHIIDRRECERPEHVALVLTRLGAVLEQPSHSGCVTREADKLDLFLWTPGDFAGVVVGVKCLAGESWVSTAFPIGRKTLRKHLNTGRLTAVEYRPLDLFDQGQ